MHTPLFGEIIALLGISIFVLFICIKLKLPTIIGFLITGIFAGPHGVGIIKDVEQVEVLAEIGVILLLFTIGIEFSLKKLLEIKRIVFIGGMLQVMITTFTTFAVAYFFDFSMSQSLFIGFILSLSSTAIMLKLLQDKGQVDSPHGRAALAISLFQDIAIVPMMLLAPMLGGGESDIARPLLLLLVKGVAIMVFVVVFAQYVMPVILYQIAKTRIRELFILSVIVICMAIAYLTSSLGLSLALGAFLAGLIISESEYSYQALSNVLPFQDIFNTFFFVSIGMLLDFNFVLEHWGVILIITFGAILLKGVIAILAVYFLGFSVRTSILAGLTLCQVGEFSFILSNTGLENGLITNSHYQVFLSVAILSMSLTPFVYAFSDKIVNAVLMLPIPEKFRLGLSSSAIRHEAAETKHIKNHLLIIGYSANARILSKAAKVAGIPYLIVESNPEIVKEHHGNGEPIFFGDATQETILEHLNIDTAKIAVIVISDPFATRAIITALRKLNPGIYIVVRTHYIHETTDLYALGANEVIPEEFETSIEIFTRVLMKYLVPRNEIEKFIAKVRSDGYKMFRSISAPHLTFSDMKMNLANIEIMTYRVGENAPGVGKTLEEIDLRRSYGVTLLAIFRNTQTIANPTAEQIIKESDVLVLFGQSEHIVKATDMFT